MLNTLLLIYFSRPRFGHRIKTNGSISDSRSKDSSIVNEVVRRFQIFFIKKLHNHKTHLTKKRT